MGGISNPPLTTQQFRVEELVGGRALFYPRVEKSAPKMDKLDYSQRYKDAEIIEKPLH